MGSLHRNGVSRQLREGTLSGVVIALIYIRVSSDEQAKEGLSLDAQLTDCRRYAANHDGWIIGTEFQDVLSGKRDDRPRYQEMLTEARRLRAEGKNVVIVVKWLHRLGRRVLERVRCREEMKDIGVSLHSVAEGGEVSDLVANILASVAEEEVRQLSERVRSVHKHVAERGWRPVSCRPWGYIWRDATPAERSTGAPKKVLEPDSLVAPYAAEAFQRVDRGESLQSVARWLMSLPETIRGTRTMNYSTVRAFLKSPVYAAMISDPDGNLRSGNWTPIVDPATWDRVQRRIASHRHVPHQASGHYLGTGFLRCPRCGARMIGMTRAYEARRPLYQCRGLSSLGANAPDPTCQYSIVQAPVDALVLSEVGRILAAVGWGGSSFHDALASAWEQLQRPTDSPEDARRQHLERERERARKRLSNAALALVDGDLDREGYQSVRTRVEADLEAIENEIGRLTPAVKPAALPSLDTVLSEVGNWEQILAGPDAREKRDVLESLIDHVVPVRTGRAKCRIEIHWTPLGEALAALAATLGLTPVA